MLVGSICGTVALPDEQLIEAENLSTLTVKLTDQWPESKHN